MKEKYCYVEIEYLDKEMGLYPRYILDEDYTQDAEVGDFVVVERVTEVAIGKIISKKTYDIKDVPYPVGHTKRVIASFKSKEDAEKAIGTDIQRDSIYDYILKKIDNNGKLPFYFNLKKYRHMEEDSLWFADGFLDYCMKPMEDPDILDLLKDIILDLNDENVDIKRSLVDHYYYNNKSKSILATIDEFTDWIRENTETIDPNELFKFGVHLLISSREIESVKIGITIFEFFDVEENPEIKKVLLRLALCNEFTFYTLFPLANVENRDSVYFEMAKKVDGYGKIEIIERIEPATPEIRQWLLTDGCENDVENGWLGIVVANKLDLPKILSERVLSDKEFKGVFNIIYALLEEGPRKGISIYDNKNGLFYGVLNQYGAQRKNLDFYLLLASIENYNDVELQNSDLDIQITDILNDSRNKEFLRNALYEADNLENILIISNNIDDFDIYEDVFEIFEKNPEKHLEAFYYLLLDDDRRDEVLNIVREKIDFTHLFGTPDSIIMDNSDFLTYMIQDLSDFPLIGTDIIASGLLCKTMQPRNAALNAIEKWMRILKYNINEMPEEFYEILSKVREKEVIKSYRERMNKILGVEEDLSDFKEPKIKFEMN